jgi:two-component system, NtrC family, response regulator GlrR
MPEIRTQAPAHPVVLIVEDSPPRLQNLQDMLEGADFLVLPASNAIEALDLANSCAGPIHLLITTLRPEGMAGPALAVSLRNRSPEMSVLYSSANPLSVLEVPDPNEAVSCMLPRPFTREVLLRRVNTLLAAHLAPALSAS